jgi:hypothetical protein
MCLARLAGENRVGLSMDESLKLVFLSFDLIRKKVVCVSENFYFSERGCREELGGIKQLRM